MFNHKKYGFNYEKYGETFLHEKVPLNLIGKKNLHSRLTINSNIEKYL